MSASRTTIRIGTRGSPLALAQVELVCMALAKVCPEVAIEPVIIKTSGDWRPENGEMRLPAEAGGKALFAKEIEAALLAGEIDAGVHSMKDMDAQLPKGLIIDHMLPREDPRDALILAPSLKKNAQQKRQTTDPKDDLSEILPEGAVIGTVSMRRAAFLLARRPDLKIVPMRGNVQTRLDKLEAGQCDATLLAMAGLNRLGLSKNADFILPPEQMLPSAGQGAIGIELREGNSDLIAIFSCISHLKTIVCIKCEREAIRALNGTCDTPIAAYATLNDGNMVVYVQAASPDGRLVFTAQAQGEIGEEIQGEMGALEEGGYDPSVASQIVSASLNLGREAGLRLKAQLPPGLFDQNIFAGNVIMPPLKASNDEGGHG